jgi:hypothetical protein
LSKSDDERRGVPESHGSLCYGPTAMSRGDPEFLNVDLDLESREPLGRLSDALPSVIVMLSARIGGKYVLSLEGSGSNLPLDQTLRRLAKMISSLSGEPQRLWRRATKRSFNIGFACGSRRGPTFSVQSATIQAVAAIGASVEITLYPPRKRAQRRS